jgi:hypothetical protein
VTIPLVIRNHHLQPARLTVAVALPENWKPTSASLSVTVPGEGEMTAAMPVIAPAEESRNFAEIRVTASGGGIYLFEVSLYAAVNAYVAEQLKW